MWLRHFLGWLRSAFCAREDLILENLALRQQLLALHSQRPRRRLTAWHKLFWVVLRSLWTRWKEPLILVTVPRHNPVRLRNQQLRRSAALHKPHIDIPDSLRFALRGAAWFGSPSSLPWRSPRWRESFEPCASRTTSCRSHGSKAFPTERRKSGIQHLVLCRSSQ
jgi:hypothetical protein